MWADDGHRTRHGTCGDLSLLDEAIRRAEANEPAFAASLADSRSAQLDKSIARAGLLPSATIHNQYLVTQGNGSSDRIGPTTTSAAPRRFIANNAVHEYASEGVVNENCRPRSVWRGDAGGPGEFAARAAAELEVARRGLRMTVLSLYYSVAATEAKLESRSASSG